MSEQSSYRQVVKATSIFGGVQVFNIIISVLRAKIIAVFLGAAGMGISGLFYSAMGLIGVASNFGLDTSAVKALSATESVSREVSIIRRLAWISAVLGALLTIVFSSLLSQLTFGNADYTLGFVWLALAVMIKQLSVGQLSILQGLRKIEFLAKANLAGSFLGLLVAVPLYYFFRIDAIVPAILVSVIVSYIVNAYFVSKLHIATDKIPASQALKEGKPMLTLGLTLSFITIVTTLAGYALQIYISHRGGLQQTGFFNAGFAIINSYVGLVFNAMASDYFPRLSAISHDNGQTRKIVTQQSFTALLIMTPIVVFFMLMAPFVVQILYSKEFLPIVMFVSWGMLGMLFKAVSWSMGYVLIAKSDSKLFMATSIGFNSVFLANNILGYYFYGLQGLGISFLANHLIHFLGLKIITRKRYDFYFDLEFYKTYAICLGFCGIGFLFTYISDPYLKYGLLSGVALTASAYCFDQINKKINLVKAISKKWNRK